MPRQTDDSDPRQPLIPNVSSSSYSRPESGYSTIVDVASDDSDNTISAVDDHDDFHHGIGHRHYSDRTPWLRAAVLGANDGLVSVAALMLGVGGGNADLQTMILSGVAALVAGALSMACGEYVSVASQKDTEEADTAREKQEFLKGPAAQAREMAELAHIYESRGLSKSTAMLVAKELHDRCAGNIDEIVKVHMRDELNVDLDELANPVQAAVTSAITFSVGAMFPLLAGAFISDWQKRIYSVLIISTIGLILNGAMGAHLGGAALWKGAVRVLIGGWIAMGATFGVGYWMGGTV